MCPTWRASLLFLTIEELSGQTLSHWYHGPLVISSSQINCKLLSPFRPIRNWNEVVLVPLACKDEHLECKVNTLNHLCRMYFPILINWTSSFQISGLLDGIFYFYSNFKRNFCKQTVKNLIRCRVLRRLIWFCTVCLCPTKRTLGLYGLTSA